MIDGVRNAFLEVCFSDRKLMANKNLSADMVNKFAHILQHFRLKLFYSLAFTSIQVQDRFLCKDIATGGRIVFGYLTIQALRNRCRTLFEATSRKPLPIRNSSRD